MGFDNRLRVLQVHNEYRQGWGGENTVADLEAGLLRLHGHEVKRLLVSTGELDHRDFLGLMAAGVGNIWSFRGYLAVKRALSDFVPDVMHVHNTFPLLSPSVYWAAAKAGIPVVQTLHNFRLTCANSLLLRGGAPCQQCVGRFPWSALRYRCYRESFWTTAAVVASNVLHRCLGTFAVKVQAYIVLTEFSKEIMVRSGLPRERIFVKPNFTTEPAKLQMERFPQILFVGIIARHKGVHLLLDAWKNVAPSGHRLVLIGDGPDRADLERRYASDSILWRGSQPHDKVMETVAASRFLVMSSLCYENFPMVLLEAFSVGTPVIGPDHGAVPSLISHQQDGLLFSAGSVSSLAATLNTALNSNGVWSRWSENARNKYLHRFTGIRNYAQLVSIYREAIAYFRAMSEKNTNPDLQNCPQTKQREHKKVAS